MHCLYSFHSYSELLLTFGLFDVVIVFDTCYAGEKEQLIWETVYTRMDCLILPHVAEPSWSNTCLHYMSAGPAQPSGKQCG